LSRRQAPTSQIRHIQRVASGVRIMLTSSFE